MKRIIQNISIITTLFISSNVLQAYGIHSLGFVINFGLIIVLVTIYTLFNYNFLNKEGYSLEIFYLLSIILIFLFGENNMQTILMFMLPIFLRPYLINNNERSKDYKCIIIFFFLIEIFLSIYERTYGINLFPIIEQENLYYDEHAKQIFRATALRGHPLANSLTVSIILSFLIINIKNIKIKFLFYILGYISFFAFNTRGCIIVWLLISLLFFYDIFKVLKTKNRVRLLVFLSVFIISSISFLMESTWGGRIFHEKVLDGSAMTRIEAYDFLKELNINDILFGYKYSYPPTENGYLNLLIRYGFIFGTFFIITQLSLIVKYLKEYHKLNQKAILFFAFAIVGQTNNALNDPFNFYLFTLCSSIFYDKRRYFSIRNNTIIQ